MAGLFEKAKALVNSEQGERISDQALDRAADIAAKRTGGSHDEQIRSARNTADQHIGTE
jgi:hypothetical protein